ncbi:MAG: GDSL-type esterase/lipase family protein [Dialister sp.]|nr:GDSL-type esterase/lipase family protein [Dialister sp.]
MKWDPYKIRKIHFFGDSLTAGYGALFGKGWVSLLETAYPSTSCINHGACGNMFRDMIDEIHPFLSRAESEEAFFLMGGTNDILSAVRLSWLMSFAEKEISLLAKSIPLAVGLPPLPTRTSCITGWQTEQAYNQNTKDLLQWNNFLKTLCQSLSIPWIDFAAALPQEDHFYYDGLHPNTVGYELFFKAAAAVLFPPPEPDT